MEKPKIFISSTIFDFSDLRSSLKFWLEESGYEVQMSESSDFNKDSSQNSYDACLSTIESCDYFILLIGSRVGGMYDKETHISITRKEYQTAYELAKVGKISKILTFVRRNIYDILEERKDLKEFLKESIFIENEKPISPEKVAYYDSRFLHDACHIKDFIDEVSRKSEFKEDKKPSHNWINTFNNFTEIIEVLNLELSISTNIQTKIAEQNIARALAYNIAMFTNKTKKGKIYGNFFSFKDTREKLFKIRQEKAAEALHHQEIEFDRDEIHNISNFILFCSEGIDKLEAYMFEDILSKGIFLKYDKENNCYIEPNICKALYDIVYEIRLLKNKNDSILKESKLILLKKIQNYHQRADKYFYLPFIDLGVLSAIFERQYNIYLLTNFMFEYIKKHDDGIKYPTLYNGLVDSETPTPDEVLAIFQ